MDRWLGTSLVMLAALAFGLMAYFNSLARADDTHTFMILFLRFGIAGAIMVGWMVIRGVAWPRGWTCVCLVLMGAVLYVGESLCYFVGLEFAPPGIIALLLYVYPVIVAVLARVLFKERLTAVKMVAMGLALTGTALMFLTYNSASPIFLALDDSGSIEPEGIVLGLGSAVIYAIYIIVGARVTRRVDASAASTLVIASAAVVFGALAFTADAQFPTTREAWVGCIGLAIVCTVIAIGAFLAGLRRIGPVRASTFSTAEPLATVVVSATLMNLPGLTTTQMIGGSLIVVGAIVMALAREQPPAHAGG